MLKNLTLTFCLAAICATANNSLAQTISAPATLTASNSAAARFEYKVLATNRVATMEKEMNDAAKQGFAFQEAVSGET